MLLAEKALPMTCQQCRESEDRRREWACDAASVDPIARIPCVRCNGGDPACDCCDGTGEEGLHRCPLATIAMRGINFLFQAYGLMRDGGILPEPGGLLDQSPAFLDACAEIDWTRDWAKNWRERQMEAAKSAMRRAQARARESQSTGPRPNGAR